MKDARGRVRRSQLITTFGPGALIDLPNDSGIVAGLDYWPDPRHLEEVKEPRLAAKLSAITGVPNPRLYAPPAAEDRSGCPDEYRVKAWRFPEWFLVQEAPSESPANGHGGHGRRDPREQRSRSRRLVHRKSLDARGRFAGQPVVPTRFVRACPRGHIEDIDWFAFVHGGKSGCRGQLWLDERGTTGDLAELVVRCGSCGASRPLYEATELGESPPLGFCRGKRPWLGLYANEECSLPMRLLVRTASNSYFPMVVNVLSLPERESAVETKVASVWEFLSIVEDAEQLAYERRRPQVAAALAGLSDADVLAAIERRRAGTVSELPVKEAELDAILSAPEGYGDDVPVDPDFHVRRLPDVAWRRDGAFPEVEAVFQLHRLREVMALAGFSRFEALVPDIHGEYESDVERADIQTEPAWFPAVENRGEGVFLQLRGDAVAEWLGRRAVKGRLEGLLKGHEHWRSERNSSREFPGGAYIMLHTLAHLLIQTLSVRAGYSASSIRERIYVEPDSGRYGILLYTGSPDAEGTLGGLVAQARHIHEHLENALVAASLCANDPICAQHRADDELERRWLHGAACHGCTLIAETSCEMRNEYLDRALVVPTVADKGAAFFRKLPDLP